MKFFEKKKDVKETVIDSLYIKILDPKTPMDQKIEYAKIVRDLAEAKIAVEKNNNEKMKNGTDILTACIRAGGDIFGRSLSMRFYDKWMREGFKYEKTGYYSSETFRNFWKIIKPDTK